MNNIFSYEFSGKRIISVFIRKRCSKSGKISNYFFYENLTGYLVMQKENASQ